MTAAAEPPAPPESRHEAGLAVALAAFFCAVQFYTSLAALSPTPPVGYLFLNRAGAAVLAAILAVAAAYAFFRLVRPGGFASPETLASRRVLLPWLLALVPATIASVDPLSSVQTLGVAAMGAAFHLALVRWYARPPVAASVVVTYLCVGGLASLASIVMVAVRRPAELFALNHGRAAGPFVTTNQLGAFVELDLFLAIGVALATRHLTLRRLAWANAALALVALALSFSRGAWIGAAAAACAYAALLGARRVALAGGIAIVIGGALVASLTIAGHNPAEAFTRYSTLEGGLRAALLFPLTGSGPMTYYEIFGSLRPSNGGLPGTFEALHPHNIFLSLAGEVGLVGLGGIVAGWLAFARGIAARLRAGSTGDALARRRLAYGICAGFVALFVQGMADLIGVVELIFVWIPYAALGLAAAANGLAE